jgi:rare lipoprotein A
MKQVRWAAVAAFAMLAGASSVSQADAAAQTGKASYYKHGARTANGERFDPHGYTAAHRTLPFGTRVLVTNMKTGISVIVRINDRGPFVKSRIIDVSYGAAKVLGITATGVATVKIVPLKRMAETPAAAPSPAAAPVEAVAENTGEVLSLR